MAENETLDLAGQNSGRWRQWGQELASGKKDAEDLSDSAIEKLIRTVGNLQRLFIKNGYPLKDVLDAATGVRGDIRQIFRESKLGRDYLELFRDNAYDNPTRHELLARVLKLIVEKFADQAAFEHGLSNNAMLSRIPEVKETLVDRIEDLAKKLAESPDTLLRQAPRSAIEKRSHQDDMLSWSVALTSNSFTSGS